MAFTEHVFCIYVIAFSRQFFENFTNWKNSTWGLVTCKSCTEKLTSGLPVSIAFCISRTQEGVPVV